MGDEKSLAHTRWNCKYHIVFAPKYRRLAFYGEKRRAIGSILRKLCEWKGMDSEAECCADHIHMLNPTRMSVSGFMGSERKSSLIYEQLGFEIQIQQDSGAEVLCHTVGKNTAKIQDYIKHQLEEDKWKQLSIPYPGSPFTGRK